MSQRKWLPFPNNFTNVLGMHLIGLSFTILAHNGELDGEGILIGQLTPTVSLSYGPGEAGMGGGTASLTNILWPLRERGVVHQRQTRALFHEQEECMLFRQTQRVSTSYIPTYSSYTVFFISSS